MTDSLPCDGPYCTTVMLDRDPVSKGLSFFSQVFPNGHMLWTVLFTMVRPAQPFWLSETLFLRVSHFFPSDLQQTHVTDRRSHDGPSCMTLITVRDPSPKGLQIFFLSVLRRTSTTDHRNCDGPSCTHRHASQRLSFRVLYLYRVQVQHDGPHDGPS